MPGSRSDDRGSVAVETVVLVPVLAALVAVALVAGRVSSGRSQLDAAAHYSAREISIARTPSAAVGAAEASARATLQVGAPTCRSMTFSPTITPTEVTVEITCAVDLSAATILPVPGTVTVRATAIEVVDTRREIP